MSRAAANQEQGTKNQEQPRSGSNSQKASPFNRRGFFMAVARTTKNKELRTKNSRAAAPNFNCRFAALLHQKSFIPHQPRGLPLTKSVSLMPLRP